MAAKVKLDQDCYIPAGLSGILTIQCSCGWETTYISPEESLAVTGKIIKHLRNNHWLPVPHMTVTMH